MVVAYVIRTGAALVSRSTRTWDSRPYNIPSAVSIEGSLDVPALNQALSDVVRRHEVLRTTLVSNRGIPCQVIAASLELPLELEDLSSLPVDERRGRAVDRMHEEIQRPFDLARGPLVRASLLRLGERKSTSPW